MYPCIYSGYTRVFVLDVPGYIPWMYIPGYIYPLDVPKFLPGYYQHTPMGYPSTYSGYTLANTPLEGCTSCQVGGCGRSARSDVTGQGCGCLTDWIRCFCFAPLPRQWEMFGLYCNQVKNLPSYFSFLHDRMSVSVQHVRVESYRTHVSLVCKVLARGGRAASPFVTRVALQALSRGRPSLLHARVVAPEVRALKPDVW